MHKKSQAEAAAILIPALLALGAVIGFAFGYAGAKAGSTSLLKTDLYAYDLAAVQDTLLSLPLETDVVFQYPHDFEQYQLVIEEERVILTRHEEKGEIQARQPYTPNKDYVIDQETQEGNVRYIKFGNKIGNKAIEESENIEQKTGLV